MYQSAPYFMGMWRNILAFIWYITQYNELRKSAVNYKIVE